MFIERFKYVPTSQNLELRKIYATLKDEQTHRLWRDPGKNREVAKLG
jgi:hypothetical protein